MWACISNKSSIPAKEQPANKERSTAEKRGHDAPDTHFPQKAAGRRTKGTPACPQSAPKKELRYLEKD